MAGPEHDPDSIGVCRRCGCFVNDSDMYDWLFQAYRVSSAESLLKLLDHEAAHPDGCDASLARCILIS